MPLLSLLHKVFEKNAPATPARVTAIQDAKGDTAEWQDDKPLRQLAAESDAGRSHWVAASDFAEFYKKFDAAPATRGARIEISVGLAAWLDQRMKEGCHLDGNAKADPIGPPYLPEMRVMLNGAKIADMAWTYNVVDSGFDFTITDKNGVQHKRRYECGMDFDEQTTGFATPAPLFPAPVKRLG